MPVLAAAFCPHPPLLAPDLAGAAAPELDGVRAACDEAVATIAEYGVPVLVLGPGPAERTYPSGAAGSLAPWGVDVRAGGPGLPTLPLSLTVGAWLLDRAGVPLPSRRYESVAEGEPGARGPADDVVLLVMADGSSTRTPKAPGGLHPGAEAYDVAIAAALGSGDPDALLRAAVADASAAVGAGGAAAWRAAVSLVGERHPTGASLLMSEAPYGVAYLVATWTWSPT